VTTLTRALSAHLPEIAWLDTSDSSGLNPSACLTASDAVLIVVSAAQGVSAHIAELWEKVAHLPTTVVITHLDARRADFDEAAAICHRVLGLELQIPFLPIHDDDATLAGFLDVLGDVIHVQEPNGVHEYATDEEHRALTQAYRDDLIDLLLAESADDATVEAMVAGSHVTEGQLVSWLNQGISTGRIHVALGYASTEHRGDIGLPLIAALVDATTSSFEGHQPPVLTLPDGEPADPLDVDGPALALVLGNDTVGTCCRVLAGSIAHGQDLISLTGEMTDDSSRITASVAMTWSDAEDAAWGAVVHTPLTLAAGTTLASPARVVIVQSG
jgi:translation elongation factor EF-G